MQNLFSAIELGKNTLLAQQQIFQMIGQNIANVNTPGYSRQVAILENVAGDLTSPISTGRGMDITRIFAVRSQFVDAQIVERRQETRKHETLHDILSQVETLFDESTGLGLSDALTDFFAKWSDVADTPTSVATRNSLVSSAQQLASGMQNAYLRLFDQREIANAQVADAIAEINGLAAEIADLNREIAAAENLATPANDLIDRRTQRIKELSDLVGINVYYNAETHSATVEVAGRPLVSYATVYPMDVVRNPANANFYEVTMTGSAAPVTGDIRGGRLEGLLQARDTELPDYLRRLDNLAYWLNSSVNAVHNGGYALDGVTTGLDFFVDFTPAFDAGPGTVTSAGTTLTFSDDISAVLHVGDVIQVGAQQRVIVAVTDALHVETDTAFAPPAAAAAWQVQNNAGAAVSLEVNPNLVTNPELIAAADAANAEGNNGTALAIAALMDSRSVAGLWTGHDYLHTMFTQIGNDVRAAGYEQEANQAALTALENKRDEISGVSLDEEAATLMQFQKAYQAMAQFLGVVNGLTDTLIQLGRV